jgi:hypothetical protein
MSQQNEQARNIIDQLQAEGMVEVDDNGNISPSKQKPAQSFHDFDNQ